MVTQSINPLELDSTSHEKLKYTFLWQMLIEMHIGLLWIQIPLEDIMQFSQKHTPVACGGNFVGSSSAPPPYCTAEKDFFQI